MKTTHFGFQDIPETEKSSRVKSVFTNVAQRYDLMNDLMSAGLHRLWKKAMVDWLFPRDGQRILDVAGGTGDIAFRMADRANVHVTVCDLTEGMLQVGADRADKKGYFDIDWICGDAMSLPFANSMFDAYTIAFGIRNVTNVQTALDEAYRVLRPGGRFVCLEFSHVQTPILDTIYDAYSFNLIPKMGKLVANDHESYQYLVESIRKFPNQDEFADMIKAAGFSNVSYRNLSQGIVALHSGWRI
jgi:demethylmenaquinone methyltransferase/2-methoxy-6-polyprenyl-1,4-benzoquinol methylase